MISRGTIHFHALVESFLHPEQLIKIGEERIRRKGLELIRSTSIVFNSWAWISESSFIN
jgi:hypothetical protein